MSCLMVNCITNWMDDDPDLGFISFDELFGRFQREVEQHFAGLSLSGEVETIHVQFQYACGDLPGMVSGSRIGRLSRKHRNLEAYVEVTGGEYRAAKDEDSKRSLMKDKLLLVLRQIGDKLEGTANRGVPELVDRAEGL